MKKIAAQSTAAKIDMLRTPGNPSQRPARGIPLRKPASGIRVKKIRPREIRFRNLWMHAAVGVRFLAKLTQSLQAVYGNAIAEVRYTTVPGRSDTAG